MQTAFTKEFMQQNCGCYSTEQLNACSFMQSEVITLDSILDSEIKTKDKFWFVCKKLATKEQNQQIAIMCAETVLHLFENKYPNDDRPRKAIQAAKDYLNGLIDLDTLRQSRYAAYIIYAIGDASYAAQTATNAAYVVDDFVNSAAVVDAAINAADNVVATLHTKIIKGLKDIINQQ